MLVKGIINLNAIPYILFSQPLNTVFLAREPSLNIQVHLMGGNLASRATPLTVCVGVHVRLHTTVNRGELLMLTLPKIELIYSYSVLA